MADNATMLLDKYWCDELGADLSNLQPNKVLLVPHGTLSGYKGIILFKRNNSVVISAPDYLLASIKNKFEGTDGQFVFRIEFFEKNFNGLIDRIIGPGWVGGISKNDFRPCHGSETRELTNRDDKVLRTFLSTCDSNDIEVSSLEVDRFPMFGSFSSGQLAAVAGFETLAGIVAHVGILTHTGFRGRGYGKKAVSLATEFALGAGLGVQYRTLVSNVPSVQIAKSLGFHDYAETIAVRLKS